MTEIAVINVHSAFKEGLIPRRSILQMTIGSVLWAPILKYVITNISKDNAKTSNIAPNTVGRIRGKTISLNV